MTGCRIVSEDRADGSEPTKVSAKHVVVAAGGIGGNLDIVRKQWPEELGKPPKEILMGSHYYADGAMHKEVTRVGGNVTHISRMWNYADAVRHPKPRRPLHGLKLIPPRSGLVLDPTGKRYGPIPLMPMFDAYYALERMMEDERAYYWMICNWKIARRELDVSGSEHNPLIREKRLIRFLLSVLLGKPTLVRYFIDYCPDFVTGLEPAGARRARWPRSRTTARSTPSRCSARSRATTPRSRAASRCSTTISCAASSRCATGAATGCGPPSSSRSSIRRRAR